MKTIIKVLFASMFFLFMGMNEAEAQRRRSYAPQARVQIQGPSFHAPVCGDYPARVQRRHHRHQRARRAYVPRSRYGYSEYNRNYRRSCSRW